MYVGRHYLQLSCSFVIDEVLDEVLVEFAHTIQHDMIYILSNFRELVKKVALPLYCSLLTAALRALFLFSHMTIIFWSTNCHDQNLLNLLCKCAII